MTPVETLASPALQTKLAPNWSPVMNRQNFASLTAGMTIAALLAKVPKLVWMAHVFQLQVDRFFQNCSTNSDCGSDGQCLGTVCFPNFDSSSMGNSYTNGTDIQCQSCLWLNEFSADFLLTCCAGLTCNSGDTLACAISDQCRCYPAGGTIF